MSKMSKMSVSLATLLASVNRTLAASATGYGLLTWNWKVSKMSKVAKTLDQV